MTKLRLTNSFPHARAAAVSGHSRDAQRGFVTQSVLQHKSTLCCSTNNPFACSSAAAKLRQVHQNPRSAEVLHLSAAYWSFNSVGCWFVLATFKELCFQECAASFASFSAADLRMNELKRFPGSPFYEISEWSLVDSKWAFYLHVGRWPRGQSIDTIK